MQLVDDTATDEGAADVEKMRARRAELEAEGWSVREALNIAYAETLMRIVDEVLP